MFHQARLKLTAWYLGIIMLISLMFSAVIYRVQINEIQRFEVQQQFRLERRLQQNFLPPLPAVDQDLVDETKSRILLILVVVNAGILVVSGGLGYFLAGQTLKPIKEMMEEQNRFISDASHELRTPLTSLKSAFEVFLRNKQPTLPEAKTLVGESIGEVNKLQYLSESLLQLAQYQKPDNYSKFEKLSLNWTLKEAIRKISHLAREKKVSLKFDSQDLEVKGNKYGLVDLFVTLLDNAVKYSPAGKSVSITTKRTDGAVEISIKDEGVGIKEKDLPLIFDRFFRADSARARNGTGGYGLGLAIAKKIVDLHHGSIRAESKVNKGSNFIVRLPTAQSET